MADPFAREQNRGASPEASAAAVTRFLALSGEVRGGAILGSNVVLAASGSGAGWEEAARTFLDAADRAAGEPVSHAHVATEEGEVFVIRSADLAMVAVTSRFTLASLMFADMRAALRSAMDPLPASTAEAA